jgi:hypothetical protein
MTSSSQQDPSHVFRRFERTSLLLASHPDFPGKPEALGRCRDDVEERFQQGMLTVEQKTRLLSILGDEAVVETQRR